MSKPWYVLESQQWHKCSSTPSIRSPVVDKKRWGQTMRSGHWSLRLVLCVPFSALNLMIWQQEGYPACKTTCSTNTERFSSGTDGSEDPRRNWLIQVHLEKWLSNGSGSKDGDVDSVWGAISYHNFGTQLPDPHLYTGSPYEHLLLCQNGHTV